MNNEVTQTLQGITNGNNKLNGLCLFSGYAGISLALKPWVKPIMYCDIEQYAQAILLSRMDDGSIPFAPIWNDVTTMDGTKLRGVVDIIYGGFPCQDISTAGKGKGLEGERSGLFHQIIRLCKEASPSFIFLENVAGIRTRGSLEVQEALASIGYDTRFGMLSAAEVGANHRRDRWFCYGIKREFVANTGLKGLERIEWSGSNPEEDFRGKAGPDGTATQCGHDSGLLLNLANPNGAGRERENASQSKEWRDYQEFTRGGDELSNPNGSRLSREATSSTQEDHEGIRQGDGWSEASASKCGIRDGEAPVTKSIGVQGLWPSGEQESFSHDKERLSVCESEIFRAAHWQVEPDVGRVVDGASIRMDSLKSMGGKLVDRRTLEEADKEEVTKLFRTDRVKALGNGCVPLQGRRAFEILSGASHGRV